MTKSKIRSFAISLLRKMKGKGWKLRMWNGPPMTFYVYNGPIQIHPACCNEYFAQIDKAYLNGIYNKDPNVAAKLIVDRAREEVNEFLKVVRESERALKGEIN